MEEEVIGNDEEVLEDEEEISEDQCEIVEDQVDVLSTRVDYVSHVKTVIKTASRKEYATYELMALLKQLASEEMKLREEYRILGRQVRYYRKAQKIINLNPVAYERLVKKSCIKDIHEYRRKVKELNALRKRLKELERKIIITASFLRDICTKRRENGCSSCAFKYLCFREIAKPEKKRKIRRWFRGHSLF